MSGEVRVEKTVFSQDHGKELRRPDIACSWNGLELVLEIQISSDFLDVIVGREDFYRKHGIFILWIFNRHDPDQYTTKNIYVGNQKNVFVFNERVKALSDETGILTFECYYKRPMLDQGKIDDVWVCRDVTLRDLTFDRERMQVFWHDYDRAEREVQQDKLLADFEKYWCRERPGLNAEEVDISARDRLYEVRFETLCGIEPGWARSQAAKALDILYAIRNTSPEKAGQHVANYRINLFAAIDVMFNSRKPFLWATLWALDVYGHREVFENRPAFKTKVNQYKTAKAARDPAYRRETRYDPLFKIIFPQLAPKLEIE